MDNQVVEQIVSAIKEDLTTLRDDVKCLTEKIGNLQLEMAGYALKDLKAKVSSNDAKIQALDSFKNKLIGALIIMQLFWGIVAAVLGALILRSL